VQRDLDFAGNFFKQDKAKDSVKPEPFGRSAHKRKDEAIFVN